MIKGTGERGKEDGSRSSSESLSGCNFSMNSESSSLCRVSSPVLVYAF